MCLASSSATSVVTSAADSAHGDHGGVENDSLRAGLGPAVPERVQRLFDASDGRYSTDGQWWVVWPAAEVIMRNRELWLQGALPHELLAIGDDGTGNPFCVPLDGRDEVLRWNWLDGAVERSEGTLNAFLADWT